MSIDNLFQELSQIEEVLAIAVGGSRAGIYSDEHSDYDVYIYYKSLVPKEKRQRILEKYCDIIELNNQYWEQEDNCILKNGIPIDIIYRNLDDFLAGLHRVVFEHQASNGYTTCLWHNLVHSKIIYDPEQLLAAAIKKYSVAYPDELRKNIVLRNMALLSGSLPAYDAQIKKAVDRKDFNSIQHRTTEFLSSYFDVIFAINKLTHPGEKRLISICLKECQILPKDFEENLNSLFQNMFYDTNQFTIILQEIIDQLKQIVKRYV